MRADQDSHITQLELTAIHWVHRRLGSWAHERRVRSIALGIFELTRTRLHLTAADRRLLALAAIVHDVGRCVSEKRHPVEGAEMIAATTLLPLPPADRRALAYFARYHRGAVPTANNEEYLRPSDDRRRLRTILAILRVADALDSRQIESPEVDLFIERGHLRVECVVLADLQAARRVYRRRKKFRMLEDLLGHPIEVSVRRSRERAHV
ncbi:MAG: HD domain-containing protein [Tepidisphaeraceae bacterium]